jgi:RNA polymerase sigma-70 factor (ECF subfamily)
LQTTKNDSNTYLNPDEQEIDKIYLDHYAGLLRYAFTIVNDRMLAEEMVHQVFFKILERTEPIGAGYRLNIYIPNPFIIPR